MGFVFDFISSGLFIPVSSHHGAVESCCCCVQLIPIQREKIQACLTEVLQHWLAAQSLDAVKHHGLREHTLQSLSQKWARTLSLFYRSGL
jgi:hypothetical protein